MLYKREHLKKSVAVTFYGQSYFSAFANFTILIIVHARYLSNKKISYGLILVCATLIVIFSQSKTMWFCLIAYSAIHIFITSKSTYRVLLLLIVVSFIFIFINNLDTVVFYLQQLKLISASSLSTVLANRENSGTLNVRIDQIKFALDAMSENFYMFGAGTGSSMYLESIYASFLYRYGIIGLGVFLFSSLAFFLSI
jgi:hypothetical protein